MPRVAIRAVAVAIAGKTTRGIVVDAKRSQPLQRDSDVE
jgi:hypothetical protein